jgi:UDP-2,3-diacylglucosamine pyrophosphatase LpxH
MWRHGVLDRTCSQSTHMMPFDLRKDRMVIFSDLHRGSGHSTDDFQASAPTYTRALEHYAQHGFTLTLLGDAEELWKESPGAVIKAHAHKTLALEREFHSAGKYVRVWGNHDDAWRSPGAVRKWLQPALGAPIEAHEVVRLRVSEHNRHLGEFTLLHGHQGTLDSDRAAAISRRFVRWVWYPLQRLTGMRQPGAAHDAHVADIPNNHEAALGAWAVRSSRRAVISGHTHRTAFGLHPWLPCYFNTGHCCGTDGTIHGIEIADGFLRLINWSATDGRTERTVVRSLGVRELMLRLS